MDSFDYLVDAVSGVECYFTHTSSTKQPPLESLKTKGGNVTDEVSDSFMTLAYQSGNGSVKY